MPKNIGQLADNAKTCDKHGISFWDYLGSRLAAAGGKAVPYLPQLVSQRCPAA